MHHDNIATEFVQQESNSSIILLGAVVLALLLSNSSWHQLYFALFHHNISVYWYGLHLTASLDYIINDDLMALFFLLVSLEVKRELIVGEINSLDKALLPVIAAIGGMLVPALIYVAFNLHHPDTIHGWAIPTATDIAFSLAILMLLGSKVPLSLKIFLTALAIIDDIGAIVIIALFYTAHINYLCLGLAAGVTFLLLLLNYLNLMRPYIYIPLALLLWCSVKASGIHPTIAGVIFGFCMPLSSNDTSPLQQMERLLQPWVVYLILPIFAFANAGFNLTHMKFMHVFDHVTLGVLLGLFFGKQFGVFGASWLACKMQLLRLPDDMHWQHLYGISILCGIGFTISLFIGNLAFAHNLAHLNMVKTGVLCGSLLSGIVGYLVLKNTVVNQQ